MMPSSPSRNSDEPPGLLKILGAVFSGVLFGVFLSKFKTPTKDDDETVHPKDSSRPETTLSPSQVAITPQIPPSPTQHRYPDRRKDNTPPWRKRAEIAAIVIAFGLLIVNCVVSYASWKTARVAEQQTQNLWTEQQPHVWVKTPDPF